MDGFSEWEPLPELVVDSPESNGNDDALLRDALAFIGDLEFDVEEDDPALLLSASSADAPLVPVAPSSIDLRPTHAAQTVVVAEAPAHSGLAAPLSCSSSSSSCKLPPRTTAAQAPRLNPSRTRRREELLYLRGLVGELEERLASLRKPTATQHNGQSENESAPATEMEPPLVENDEARELLVGAWEHIATRQHRQRRQSELENAKLRRLLQDQIQVGKSLERLLLRKRPSVDTLESSAPVDKRLRQTGPPSRVWNQAQIFDELLACCAVQYLETPRILAKLNHGNRDGANHRSVQLVHDPELGMTLQTTEHRIFPFPFDDTVHELWGVMPEISTAHRVHHYQNVDLSDDSIKVQFRVTVDVGRSNGDFTVKMANRRYNEATRTVIVISALFEPSAISDTEMDGVRMRHRGWHVLEPISGGAATKMTAYHESVPEVEQDLPDVQRKVGTLTNFLLSAISVEMESRHQSLENRLLQRSLERGQG